MVKVISIFKHIVAVTVTSMLFMTSCEKPVGTLSVSVKTPVVTSAKGQQFVSVECEGPWTISLVAEEGEVDWATLNATSGSGSRSNIILTYHENTTENRRGFKIVLDNGTTWSECSFLQFASGEIPEDEPIVSPDLTEVKWIELPAMTNSDMGYFTHSFTLNGKSHRNYTFGWSQSDYIALWVAYPLCSMHTAKKVDRTNAWAYDPLLGRGYSSAPFGGYGGSYVRGHQLPSADRLCCYEANAQTFYGTNITPQMSSHNEGIWVQLESQVRSMANSSDTTYVVTGCVVDSFCSKTRDSDGNTVTVPKAYYKALIRYATKSTLGVWNAAAFYTEHEDYASTSIEDVFLSIDELEEKIGLDLFPNLSAKIGEQKAAALEASTKIWW